MSNSSTGRAGGESPPPAPDRSNSDSLVPYQEFRIDSRENSREREVLPVLAEGDEEGSEQVPSFAEVQREDHGVASSAFASGTYMPSRRNRSRRGSLQAPGHRYYSRSGHHSRASSGAASPNESAGSAPGSDLTSSTAQHELFMKLSYHKAREENENHPATVYTGTEDDILRDEHEWEHTLNELRNRFVESTMLFDVFEYDLERMARVLLDAMAPKYDLSEEECDVAVEAVLEREREFPQSIDHSFDVLLGHVPFLPRNGTDTILGFLRLGRAVNLGALDGRPLRFLLLIIGSEEAVERHIETGALFVELFKDEEFYDDAFLASSREGMLKAFDYYAVRKFGMWVHTHVDKRARRRRRRMQQQGGDDRTSRERAVDLASNASWASEETRSLASALEDNGATLAFSPGDNIGDAPEETNEIRRRRRRAGSVARIADVEITSSNELLVKLAEKKSLKARIDQEIDQQAKYELRVIDRFRRKIAKHSILFDVEAKTVEDAVEALATNIALERGLDQAQAAAIHSALMASPRLFPDAYDDAVDILVANVPFLPLGRTKILTGCARLADQVDVTVDIIPTTDQKQKLRVQQLESRTVTERVRYVFVILGLEKDLDDHLDLGEVVEEYMSETTFRKTFDHATNRKALLPAFDATTRLLTDEGLVREDPDGLRLTRRFAGGLVGDIRRRAACYKSDFTDGMNQKVLSATLLLWLATLTPAIAFGGLMDDLTEARIGVVEMIAATAFCGIVFGLFAGQPLIILGGTGPLAVFSGLLYKLTNNLDIDFFEMYFWVGMWTSIFTMALAVTDSCVFIKKFTRFTDEVFATLISIIFIVEAVTKMSGPFTDGSPKDEALLSLILAIGTYYIATALKEFRKGKYLRQTLRDFLADFGLVIAIGTMTVIDVVLSDVDVERLDVPTTIEPTYQPRNGTSRDWFIDGGSASSATVFLAIIPALFATILVYMDENITARLVNRADHKLKKGAGYHLDLFIVGALIGICSLFGFPWLVAATLRSILHVNNVATTEEFVTPSGHVVEHIVRVRETRVSGVAVHVLNGLSLLLTCVMKNIPLPTLYGLFLYMGISSLTGNQFWDRIKLLLTDPALYPPTHYVRKVQLKSIHKFTLIQGVCLVVLWIIKSSVIGILFPLFIVAVAGVREFVEKRGWFSKDELHALDAHENLDVEHDATAGENAPVALSGS